MPRMRALGLGAVVTVMMPFGGCVACQCCSDSGVESWLVVSLRFGADAAILPCSAVGGRGAILERDTRCDVVVKKRGAALMRVVV